ncbi:glutamate-5-semialdehyde dehydrogenase [Hirschia baltica]|uniref:Gamma-glutamyl phosphate reductase n=1 Tax=Hirschia baltica (strain ATCC 49814 / DSM 5838 / IFAM 1418) TaxID=582402 RepID=C6XL37_HIRBI|nr:glutamate-5-semialdehyde dehydrogenase [Hirschia baltica]ACT57866.1 gamma-glutamyl phosphate reductase [Hirschia baltica ATCC 49814]
MTKNFNSAELESVMLDMGARARAASALLAKAGPEARTKALNAMATRIRENASSILEANAKDMVAARAKDLTPSLLDRLELSADRLESIAQGLENVANVADPVGDVLASWERPNGLKISRVRGPIGVIGIIYESRPNVTADAGSLCVRSANATILRGGSESVHSATAITTALQQGLEDAGLPKDAVQMVPTTDRDAVGHMLKGLNGNLDVIVPRGGKGLVGRVQEDARVPVIGHLEGICHTYVHENADPQKAVDIVTNAKMRRTGICGSTETMLIDASIANDLLPKIAASLVAAGCELRGNDKAQAIVDMKAATQEDWSTEYLAPIISIKVVENIDEAIAHVETYSSGHTEAIITEDTAAAERFLNDIDASIVMHNASTQFADGGEFGMGAEIGIATGRLHARGPVGAEQLTIFKYQVRGTGQTRPT